MERRFDYSLTLAEFADRFMRDPPRSERELPPSVARYLERLQLPTTEYGIREGRVFLTELGFQLIDMNPVPLDELDIFGVARSASAAGRAPAGGDSRGPTPPGVAAPLVDDLQRPRAGSLPLPGPNGTSADDANPQADAQRSLQRKRSINTLRKATLERQNKSLDRTPQPPAAQPVVQQQQPQQPVQRGPSSLVGPPQPVQQQQPPPPRRAVETPPIARSASERRPPPPSPTPSQQARGGVVHPAQQLGHHPAAQHPAARSGTSPTANHRPQPSPLAQQRSPVPQAQPRGSPGPGPGPLPHQQHQHHQQPTTAPPEIVKYMDTLTRTYRQSTDPKILNQMLRSDETTRVGEYLEASRTGTLTRGFNLAAARAMVDAVPEFRMDPYCQSVYQWLCQVSGEPLEDFPSLAAAVRSGGMLAALAKRLIAKPPPSDFLDHDPSYSIHKLIFFLDCCRMVGVKDDDTFPLTDLMVDDGDPRPLVRTLIAFDAAARKRGGGWNGPSPPRPPPGYFDGPWVAPRAVPAQLGFVKPPEAQRFTYVQDQTASVYQSLGGATSPMAPNFGAPGSRGSGGARSPMQPQPFPSSQPQQQQQQAGRERSNTFPTAAQRPMHPESARSPGIPGGAGGPPPPMRARNGPSPPTSMAMANGPVARFGNRERLGSDAESVGGFAPHEVQGNNSHVPSAQVSGILNALLEQEELFLQDLQIIVDWQAILNKKPVVLTSSEQRTLFCNAAALLELHTSLVPKLQQAVRGTAAAGGANRASNSGPVEAVAHLLLSYASDFLREYEIYYLNNSALLDLLESREQRPLLHHMLNDFLLWPKAHGMSLESYLYRAGSHLATYTSKLSEILAVGGDAVNTMPTLRRALEVLEDMLKDMEAKRTKPGAGGFAGRVPSYLVPSVVEGQDADLGFGTATMRRNLNQAVDIAALESSTRRFICQGSVWEVVHAGEVKVRSLLLFHDVLVIAKEVPPNKFEVRNLLDLRTLTVRPTRDRQRSALRLRPVVAQAVNKFNANPGLAVEYLVLKKVLDTTPSNIASFLHKTPNLSRRQVGKYIGAPENERVAHAYADWFGPVFTGLPFEDALRLYLSSVRLTNDGPAIDRVLTAFAIRFLRSNPDKFSTDDAAINLVFATIMLNADMHGATGISGTAPLGMRDFVAAHPDVAAGQLQSIYQSVQGEKLAMASDSQHRVQVDVNSIPTFLTLNEPSEWLRVAIPAVDDAFTLRIVSTPAIRVEPPVLAFAKSPIQYVRITGTALGRHRLYFLPGGPTAAHYDYVLPVTVTVEPPYMKHTFAIEVPNRAAATAPPDSGVPRRSTLTFSVATDEQRQRWVNYITNAIDQLKYAAAGPGGPRAPPLA
ncbi:hypothetical protein H9P43_001394 [Blastocladiella emersonii ATCC 22665]|nr:hypothetical protein H9P43_001394 [Blastocladiella emersonii ATCC 22665]